MGKPAYSIVIPTYKRPDVLAECLGHIAALEYDARALDVVVIDNGEKDNSAAVAEPFFGRFPLRYLVNERNGGPGFSINRGLKEATGERIVILNDDALLYPGFLADCDRTFARDPAIGCVGCRALEDGYAHEGTGIGTIDEQSRSVVGNFDEDCGRTIEVDHVYGFCYVITRAALEKAGPADPTLLATSRASGNRLETDHCLCIKRHGLKVVYNPAMAVRHLAKPRADMSEVSFRWKLNETRNTLYLFLKHFGMFGRRGLALRYTFLHDVGILSALRRPSAYNTKYFLWGLRARASAYYHYLRYLVGSSKG